MAITLELTPEQEGRLKEGASRRGVAPEAIASEALAGYLASEAPEPSLWETLGPDEWERATDEWIAGHDPDIPPLSDDAVSRESLYEGRP